MDQVKKPRLKRDWIGRHVLTLTEMRNGWGIIPAGTRMVVKANQRSTSANPGSLQLETETRCECCGLRATISRVLERDVQLLPETG